MKIIKYLLVAWVLINSQFTFGQDYWTRLNGPFGGSVLDLKMNSNGHLVAMRNEGIYTSSNSGDSWSKIPSGTFSTNLCMDITSSGIIYAGKSSGGLWWSSNTGQSWSFNPINIAPHSGQWATVIIVKVNSLGHVYINNHVSLNGGQNFNTFTYGGIPLLSRDYAFNSSNHVYAATQNGIFFSMNNASTWTNINGNLPSNNATCLMFDNDTLVAGVSGRGVFKTTNNGVSWIALNNGINDLNITKIHKDIHNNYLAGTSTGKVYISGDRGLSWTLVYSNPGDHINSIFSDGTIYISTNQGLLNSIDNGLNWTDRNNTLILPGINSLAFPDGNKILAASASGIFYSQDNGANWKKRVDGLPASIVNSIFRCPNGDILTGTRDFGIYRSTNEGLSWLPSNNGISEFGIFNFVNSPNGFIFATQTGTIFTDTLDLYRSSDNGLSWVKIFRPESNIFNSITIDASGNLFLVALSSFQTAFLKSTDNGSTWSKVVLAEFFFIDKFVSSGTNLYLTVSGNIYRSSDLGSNWTQIPNGSWQTSTFSAFNVNRRGDIFLTSGSDVYVTTNNGLTWTTQNSGLPLTAGINKFVFDNSDFIYGLTFYEGIFKSLESTITSVGNSSISIPENYTLSQNYPNPFNPVTNLEFGISDLGFVSLKVHDILGNEVAVLVNEMKNAGNYNYQLSTVNYQLTSGIYFYSLFVNGNLIDTKKMILIK